MSFSKWILLAAVAPWLSTSALAAPGDPGVSTTVDAVPTAVTLSRPAGTGKGAVALDTFAAYKFTVSNGGSSTINRVFLNGTATSDVATAPVVFVSSIPADACVVDDAAANKVKCFLPSLAPSAVSAPIVVVFKSPTAGTQISFVSTSGGFEGSGGGNGCCSETKTTLTTLVDSTTSSTFTTEAKTFVRPDVGVETTVFTGDSAIVTSADGWSTLVTIKGGFGPTSLGGYTVATIKETSTANDPPAPLVCPGYALRSTCFASDLSIPGTFADPLLITLRLHKDYFKLGNLRPADVKLYYTATGAAINITVPLELCSAISPPATAPSPGTPCLSAPPSLIKSSSQIPRDLWGALEFKVQAGDNGKYSQ